MIQVVPKREAVSELGMKNAKKRRRGGRGDMTHYCLFPSSPDHSTLSHFAIDPLLMSPIN